MVLHGRGAFWLGFLSLFILNDVQAADSVCARRSSSKTMSEIVSDPSQRLSFENEGGLLNGGVCWWHSRFQRAAWSLAEFHPELSKPTRRQAIRIIKALSRMREVVNIPGYSGLYSFSADFKAEIQHELNDWQLRDAFVHQAWVRGLSGRSNFRNAPERFKSHMNRLFKYSQSAMKAKFIPWIMLQMKGITSHAALLVGMKKTDDGYILETVESNFPEKTFEWRYQTGATQVETNNYDFVPYSGFSRDADRTRLALDRFCAPSADSTGLLLADGSSAQESK